MSARSLRLKRAYLAEGVCGLCGGRYASSL